MRWFESRQDGARLLHLAGAMYDVWYFRGHVEEGAYWLERAMTMAPPGIEPEQRGWVAKGLAMFNQLRR